MSEANMTEKSVQSPSQTSPLLEVRHLKKYFTTKKGLLHAVAGDQGIDGTFDAIMKELGAKA